LVNAGQSIEGNGTITISTGFGDSEAWVAIADTGCGIAPENMNRIFDPFYTTKPVGQGTGLGLSVSHSIVRKHGGRIDVDSEPGKGTRFTVRLPLPARGAETSCGMPAPDDPQKQAA
jgi:signal transduction histidine kinase